jgi:sugar lactone lactonase YvrE
MAAYPAAIGRADIDGTGADQSFISVPATHLAVDAEHIYWTNPNSGAIGRANLDGTGIDKSFIPEAFAPSRFSGAVRVDPQHIYWANGQNIARANLDGTGVDKSFISDPGGIDGVAVDSEHVYWTTYEWIGRADLDGSDVDPHFIFPSPAMLWHGGVVVDSAHIYSVFLEEQDPIADDQVVIGRANLDGSGVGDFIDLDSSATELAIDPAHLYWAYSDSIGRADLDGTDVEDAFITGGYGSVGMAVDSDHVYWTNASRPGLRIGKPTLQKRRGTATLPVKVFGPGELQLAGKGLRVVTETAESADKFRLAVKPKGAKERKLERRGSVRVTPEVTFTLTGAGSLAKSEPLRLVERRGGSREAFDARGGRYAGEIGGDPVRFKVTKNDKVKNAGFTLITGSQSHCLIGFAVDGRDKISHDGKFKITDDDASIKGEFVSRSKVEGRVTGTGCHTTSSPYTARRLGGHR